MITRLRRLPIRVRLTLAFALAMAVVLGAIGLALLVRLSAGLDEAIDQGLHARAEDVAALVRRSGPRLGTGRSSLAEADVAFAQVVDARGRVVGTTSRQLDRPVLSRRELARARGTALLVDRGSLPGLDDEWRLLATPVEAGGRQLVVVVGASLEGREETLGIVAGLLVVGGPVALVLASLAGYLLGAAALRPVEAMRRRAAEISAATAGERLPVPETRDEISRLGETLNAMLERLQTGLERERRFVADASHELRTPLALVKTELELGLRRTRSHEELEAVLRSAAEEVDRMAQLADDLLLLARSDEGGPSIRPTRCEAAEILESIAARYGRRAAAVGRAIECRCAPGLVLHVDRPRVEQALGNLVENALQHGSGLVSLTSAECEGAIQLHVTDEGRGFPPEFLPRAFERFSRADEARRRAGVGLGLAIVEAVASAHGGTAEVSNRDEGGADAWFSLPVASR